MTTFMERVAQWYSESTLHEELDLFLEANAKRVETDAGTAGEQTHENMEVYAKFQKCIENGLTSFCKSEGITEEEFYKQCSEEAGNEVFSRAAPESASTHPPNPSQQTSSQILTAVLASASYEAFIELVTEWKEESKSDD